MRRPFRVSSWTWQLGSAKQDLEEAALVQSSCSRLSLAEPRVSVRIGGTSGWQARKSGYCRISSRRPRVDFGYGQMSDRQMSISWAGMLLRRSRSNGGKGASGVEDGTGQEKKR